MSNDVRKCQICRGDMSHLSDGQVRQELAASAKFIEETISREALVRQELAASAKFIEETISREALTHHDQILIEMKKRGI